MRSPKSCEVGSIPIPLAITMDNEQYKCHDCGKQLRVEHDIIMDGKMLKYKEDDNEYFIVKCDNCFQKSKALSNFRKCEIYSRVVGYLRPVQQWNPGKKEEFKDRIVYDIKGV